MLNRVKDTRFPNTICEVIEQGPVRESWKTRGKVVPDHERKYFPIRNRCQFSWFCDGKSDKVPEFDLDVYELAMIIAFKVMHGQAMNDFTEGATHYHATYVNPEWAESKTKTIRIKDHIFYRWEK